MSKSQTKKNKASGLTVQSVPVDSLTNDQKNAREHSHHNMEAIKESLRRWGLQKPIVVDHQNVVIAGNGTLAAARELGWENIDIVRTDLTEAEKMGYAIADNRTSELSDWDEIQLAATLQEIAIEDIASTGFSQNDLNKMLNKITKTLELRMEEDDTLGTTSDPGLSRTMPNVKTDAPSSHVRMVQLYFDVESIEIYLDMLKMAAEVLETDNPTDTVLAALEKVTTHEND